MILNILALSFQWGLFFFAALNLKTTPGNTPGNQAQHSRPGNQGNTRQHRDNHGQPGATT
ncbi:hypothetical protein P120_gp53 [Pelagibacter phage HTVC120P]|nr:hypothetical protein P120_gp53 [Pelagibacter phage HTVC120P]